MDFSWRWVRKPADPLGPRTTVLTACDKRYLPYAKALLRSIDHFSPGQTFVVLLIDHDQDDLAELEVLASEVRHTTVLTASDTTVTPAPMSREQRLAYYASARFLFARSLLDQASGPVMCIDADSLVVGSLEADTAVEAGADVALWRRDKSHAPDHQKVAAGVVVLFPTRGAKLFATRVSEILTARFAAGEALWYVDQAALFRAMTELAGRFASRTCTAASGTSRRSAPAPRCGRPRATARRSASRSRRCSGSSAIPSTPGCRPSTSSTAPAASPQQGRHVLQDPSRASAAPAALGYPLPARIDLPWKPYKGDAAPALSDDTLAVRLTWKRFASLLANRFETKGVRMEIQEIPAWEITPERSTGRAAISHSSPTNATSRCRAWTFRSFLHAGIHALLFTLDPAGWGAGASAYPVSARRSERNPGRGAGSLRRLQVAARSEDPRDQVSPGGPARVLTDGRSGLRSVHPPPDSARSGHPVLLRRAAAGDAGGGNDVRDAQEPAPRAEAPSGESQGDPGLPIPGRRSQRLLVGGQHPRPDRPIDSGVLHQQQRGLRGDAARQAHRHPREDLYDAATIRGRLDDLDGAWRSAGTGTRKAASPATAPSTPGSATATRRPQPSGAARPQPRPPRRTPAVAGLRLTAGIPRAGGRDAPRLNAPPASSPPPWPRRRAAPAGSPPDAAPPPSPGR